MRNVYYIGISTCVPDIEKEKLKGYEEKREAVKQRLAYLATL